MRTLTRNTATNSSTPILDGNFKQHKNTTFRQHKNSIMNDTGIVVVSRARGNITWVAPLCVMMDLGAQPITISKGFARGLGLTAKNLARGVGH